VQRGLVAEVISRFEKRGYKLVGARLARRRRRAIAAAR
jgi:nucleoside diphosphate kinase